MLGLKKNKRSRYPTFKVKITALGYTFIATSIGVGIASLNTGNNLLYLTFSMMLSFIILSGILSNISLHKVKLAFKNQPRFFAQELSHVPISLHNTKPRFSSYAVNLAPIASKKKNQSSEDILDAQKSFVLKIQPKEKIDCMANFSFPKRGLCQFPDFNLETYFPFGLLKKYIQIENEASILVFPKKLKAEHVLHYNKNFIGTLTSQNKNISGNPSGLREYVQGDHYKNIHWKSSARTLTLRVKEFEIEESKDVGIHLILQHDPGINEPMIVEKCLSYICTLLLQLQQHKIPCFVKINSASKIRSAHGVDPILKQLALYNHKEDGISAFNLNHLKENQTSIVVTNLNKALFNQNADLNIIDHQALESMS